MGELMVLSGPKVSTINSEYLGWNLSKPGTVSDNIGDGGISFYNPSTDITVKLEILVCH